MPEDIELDIVAVAAHPDDTEIGCGGTLAKAAAQGYRVGIIDLTDGEPTPGSPSPEVRLKEAQRASEILGITLRETLSLANRRLFDDFESRLELARALRKYRPRLVISIGGKTIAFSPDHYQAMLIAEAAVFYCKLTKWERHFDPYPPCPVPRLIYWPAISRDPGIPHNDFVVDITETFETKVEAILAYKTQFSPGDPNYERVLKWVEVSARHNGVEAGFQYGELFCTPQTHGTDDVMKFLKLA